MTPDADLARRRALAQMMGGALPEAQPEVDVSEVPEVPLTSDDDVMDGTPVLPSPPPELTTGAPQQASSRDYYAEALAQQKQGQLLAGLNRAGSSVIHALSGVAPDAAYQEQLEQQAKEPVVQYLQRQKVAGEQQRADLAAQALRAKAAASDPNSPVTLAARKNLKVNFPSLTDADLEGVTAANAHDFGVIRGQSMQQMQHAGDKVSELEQKALDRRLRTQEIGLKAEALHQQRNQFASTLGFKYEELTSEEQRAVDRLLESKSQREQQETHHTEDQTKAFGDKYEASGLPEFYTNLKVAQDIVGKHKGNLPGVGPLKGRTPGIMLSEDGKRLRGAAQQMQLAYRKSITGTGAGEKEQEDIAKATMLMSTNDDESIALGLQMMKGVMDAKADALKAGYKPEAMDAYLNRLQAKPGVFQSKPKRVPVTSVITPGANGAVNLDAPQPGAEKPSRPDKRLDPTKEEARRTYSKDGKWLKVYYKDGTYGLGPSDR